MYIEKRFSEKSFLRIYMGRIIHHSSKAFGISCSVFQGAEPVFRQLPCAFPFCDTRFFPINLKIMPIEQAKQERGIVEVLLLFVRHCELIIAFEVFSIPPYSGYFSGILPASGRSAT